MTALRHRQTSLARGAAATTEDHPRIPTTPRAAVDTVPSRQRRSQDDTNAKTGADRPATSGGRVS